MSRYHPSDIVFLGAKRSPLGSLKVNRAALKPVQLGAPVLKGLLESLPGLPLSGSFLDQLIIGQAIGAGTGQNLPRQVTRALGLLPPSSAFIVNQLCGSSLEGVLLARQGIITEGYALSAAGGIECPSRAPYILFKEELIENQDITLGEAEPDLKQASLYDALWCAIHDKHTIVHGEDTTARWVQEMKAVPGEVKDRIDMYAAQSHRRALKAQEMGWFDRELVPLGDENSKDKLPRRISLEKLGKRKGTAYTPEGVYLSALNSPPLADGAAYTLLSTYEKASRWGITPMARILDYSRVGTAEEDYLMAPVLAVKELLKKRRMNISDFDTLELNPAFGSQMLFYEDDLKADMSKVNPLGDCIALGHPIGAAGARLLTTLLHTLEREDLTLGLTAICMGGGNGIALAVERCR